MAVGGTSPGTRAGAGSGSRDGARHEAVLYSSPDELAARLAPRIDAAMRTGGPVVAVLEEENRTALMTVLGGDAGSVDFADPTEVHSVPAFTVATRWARASRGLQPSDRPTTVISQPVEGIPNCGPEHWARLDMALNVAIEGLPITVLCPYPAGGPELARVEATHPLVSTGADVHPSSRYRRPHETVVEYPPPPPPELAGPEAELAFDAHGLAAVRAMVVGAGSAVGLAGGRLADFVLAVNEVASNAVEHGPGHGRLRVWTTGGEIVAEVADAGRMDVRFPGVAVPPPSGPRGRGLWLASEMCDVLQVWSGDATDGTVARLRVMP
jgi:anti-sigma regulatory factor (Ser/Thr protein kinase)